MNLLAVIAAACLAASPVTMRPGPQAVANLLAELAKRRPAATDDRAREVAVDLASEQVRETAKGLRSIFENHPKQKALYRSLHKRKVTRKTRRAGATAGGVRELMARAIEIPGFRASVVHTTRIEARARAWQNDTGSGFVDVLVKYGAQLPNGGGVDVYDLGGIKVEVRDAECALEFSNGARIELVGLDNLRALRKKRGNSKHVIWIDEAQDFRFLDEFYKAVVLGSLTDYRGECWLSGTPGQEPSGLFYEASRDDEERLAAWEVHEITVVDNPYFGCVVWERGEWFVVDNMGAQSGPYADEKTAQKEAERIRWDNTAGAHIRDNNLKVDDSDIQREWFAKWVKGDLAYVYPVNVVPKHKLIFGPQRLMENPFKGTHPRFDSHPLWYDHEAAMRDLPRKHRGVYQWLFGIGADFGYNPDPFAIVVRAFCRELPGIYEMFSWKHTRVLTDDQGAYLKLLYETLPNCIALIGDPAGKQDDFETWRLRLNIPIEEANKQGKNTLEAFLADSIRAENVHYREGSPLLLEHKHLTYLPKKPGKTREVDKHRVAADGKKYGDHCSDADRYLYAEVDHYLFSEKPPDDRTDHVQQENKHEAAIDRAHEIREAMAANAPDDYDDGYDY